MNKVITFLGIGDYEPTTYHYFDGRQSASVRYFALALAQFFPDYQIIVLATPDAQQSHGNTLQGQLRQLSANFRIEPTYELTSENELWDTFEIIQQQVQDGDRLVVDITHSFRSLPFLAFLVLAYLRVVRDFDLEAVLYAPRQSYDRSKVYNLSPFVDLLDWTMATHLFLETGHAALLVQRLEKSEWSQTVDASALEKTSAALRLARPDEARRLAYAWANTLANLDPLDLDARARPFGLLLKQIQAEFEQIASESPNPNDLKQELGQGLALICWNSSRGQLMPTVVAAREWLVSLMCWHAGWTGLVTENGREVRKWRSKDRANPDGVLRMLNHLAELAGLSPSGRQNRIGSVKQVARDLWQAQPDYAEQLGQAWEHISKLRDDLCHAGEVYTTDPRSLDMLMQEAQQVPGLLQALFDQPGLNIPNV